MYEIYDKKGKVHFKNHAVNAAECVATGEYTWHKPQDKKRKKIVEPVEAVKEEAKEEPMEDVVIDKDFLERMNKIPLVEFIKDNYHVELDRRESKTRLVKLAMDVVKGEYK